MADFLKEPILTSPATIGDLVVDVLILEEEDLPNRVTRYAVEDGSPGADHVISDPYTLSLQAMVSNAPIREHSAEWDAQARVTRKNPDLLVGDSINFADVAWQYLKRVRLAREPITVTTKRGIFPNLLIARVSRRKDRETGDALIFSIYFQEFQRKKLTYVAVPRKRTKSGRAQPVVQGGKKSTSKKADDYYGSIGYKVKEGIKAFLSKGQ